MAKKKKGPADPVAAKIEEIKAYLMNAVGGFDPSDQARIYSEIADECVYQENENEIRDMSFDDDDEDEDDDEEDLDDEEDDDDEDPDGGGESLDRGY